MKQVHALIENRSVAAYLGMAVGDALGSTLEFMTPSEIKEKYGIFSEIIGGGWLKLKPGQVTDDTTMSLALGDSILQKKGIYPHAIAQAFSDWLTEKPVDVGNTVRKGIIHYRYSGIPIVPESDSDAGNGACMRTLPIALSTLFQNETRIRLHSRDQTHITHNNGISDAATECIIFLIQDALLGADKFELRDKWITPLINKYPIFEYKREQKDNPSGYIVDTIQAVFQAFLNNNSFESSLIDVVNRGGDSDTTGAILGMLAGSYYGLADIPKKWLDRLDSNIAQTCELQARALLTLAISNDEAIRKPDYLVANG